MAEYVLTSDVVIPAGTVLASPPTASTRWGSDFEAVVGLGCDHTSYWSVTLADALAIGLVEVK